MVHQIFNAANIPYKCWKQLAFVTAVFMVPVADKAVHYIVETI